LNPYLIGSVLVTTGVISFGAGWLQRHKAALEDDMERTVAAKTVVIKQQVVTERIVTKYKDRIIEIEGKGTHVKEVIERTAPPADLWPDYYRRVHDAAARGDPPPDTKRASDTSQTLEAAATFSTIDANYRACHANAEQLTALQKWAMEQANVRP